MVFLACGDEVRFLGLTPEVFLVELGRELPRFLPHRFVGREQEPRRDVRRAHPSGGVDARGEHECDLVAVDRLADESAAVEQRAQPDCMRPSAQGRQAESRDDPILADERHDVGERADGRHLDEAGEPTVLPLPTAQCLDELQGDTDAGEVLVGVGAVVTLGVDDRRRHRQLVVGLVVIGDDEVHAKFTRAAGRVGAADAAVHRDDQPDALAVETFDGCRLQAVAVAEPFRDEVDDLAPEKLQRTAQDDRRGDAIHIVVAMDRDALVASQSRFDSGDRGGHVGELERIVQVIERRVEEPCGILGVTQAAQAQQARHRRVHVERCGQARSLRVVTRHVLPDE